MQILKIIALVVVIVFCLLVNFDYYVTKDSKIDDLQTRVAQLEKQSCLCPK